MPSSRRAKSQDWLKTINNWLSSIEKQPDLSGKIKLIKTYLAQLGVPQDEIKQYFETGLSAQIKSINDGSDDYNVLLFLISDLANKGTVK